MSAKFWPNAGISQIGCSFLKAILDNQAEYGEVKSTEEVLNAFNVFNKKLEKVKKSLGENGRKISQRVIGSMDIKQFYPSIKPAKVALVAKMMWNKSDISVKNVDVEKLLKYVSKEISKEKLKWLNLDPVLFKRKLVVKKIKDKKQKPKKKSFSDIWSSPERPPNQAEIKTLIGLVIENIILLGMGNHLYQFGNQVRLQNDTGATGYDMTGLCADVYMVWWMDKFVNKLNQLNIKLDVNVRFKDDLNLMTKALPLGTRYDPKNKELHYTNPSLKCFANFSSQSEKEIYESENPEVITFYVLSQIANDIDTMISFTYDVPSNYEPKMVPILDLNVYLNQDGYTICMNSMKSPPIII